MCLHNVILKSGKTHLIANYFKFAFVSSCCFICVHSLVDTRTTYHLCHMSPHSSRLPLMSGLARDDCNYQTEGASSPINTLTSSSQPTRAYSTTSKGLTTSSSHLSLCAHKRHALCSPPSVQRGVNTEMLMESREVKGLFFMRAGRTLLMIPCHRAGAPAKAALYITAGTSQVV